MSVGRGRSRPARRVRVFRRRHRPQSSRPSADALSRGRMAGRVRPRVNPTTDRRAERGGEPRRIRSPRRGDPAHRQRFRAVREDGSDRLGRELDSENPRSTSTTTAPTRCTASAPAFRNRPVAPDSPRVRRFEIDAWTTATSSPPGDVHVLAQNAKTTPDRYTHGLS